MTSLPPVRLVLFAGLVPAVSGSGRTLRCCLFLLVLSFELE